MRADLVILDELGYLPFSATGRAITTNLSFSEWATVFGDRQDDYRSPRSPDPSLPHPRDRKRQLPLQGQRRGGTQEEGEMTAIDPVMTRRP